MNEEKFCRSCEEPVVDRIPGCPLQCGSEKCPSYKKKAQIDFHKKPIIWILGGPGSGKGTQCLKIVKKYGFVHLSTGELLRNEVAKETDRTQCLMTVMANGGLVPTDVILGLLKESMEAQAEQAKGFLIDGYPRERRQGKAFEHTIGPPGAIIYFDAKRDTMLQRLLGRAAKSTRTDDNMQTIKLRLNTFYENNEQILAQYPDKIIMIDAEQSPEQVFSEVQGVIDSLIQASSNSVQ